MMRFLTNRWFHIVLLVCLLLVAIHHSSTENDFRRRFEYITFDGYNRLHPRPSTDAIAIVDIDETSLKELGQWPWPRTAMAELVMNLKALGAKVIAFDMVFAEPDRTSPAAIAKILPATDSYNQAQALLSRLPDNDHVFAQAIQNAGNVVTGFTKSATIDMHIIPHLSASIISRGYMADVFSQRYDGVMGISDNIPLLSSAAAGNGIFMATPDTDGIIRHIPLFVKYPLDERNDAKPELYPALSIEALRVASDKKQSVYIEPARRLGIFDLKYLAKVGEYLVPVDQTGTFWVYYRKLESDEYIPARLFFDKGRLASLQSRIKDKIVFVGASAEGLRDIRSTPLSLYVPGIEVHVNIVEQILQHKFLKRPAFMKNYEAAIICLIGFVIIVSAPFVNAFLLGGATLGLIGAMAYGSVSLYVQEGVLFDPLFPSVVLAVIFLAATLLSYIRVEWEGRQVRQAFGLYISPLFMEELTSHPEKLKLGGETRDLSVMFSDIRGFTTMSEKLSPEEVIQLMNDFLTPMTDIVMTNRGTVDKYMGDAMMAFWNAPLEDAEHARHACLSALQMQVALNDVNAQFSRTFHAQGKAPIILKAGIGINSGPCSVGNMGSRQRFAYSALGDAVNLASRLEGQTKFYGVDVIVGEETRSLVKDLAFLDIDRIRVKGKDTPVRIYALIGDETVLSSPDFKDWEVAHNGMMAAYRAADFGCCAQELKTARSVSQGRLSDFYDMFAARITDYTQNRPPLDWDGVFEAREK